jgi:riboflavin synthase
MAQKVEFCPMFTGIVETTGTVTAVSTLNGNTSFWVSSPISAELKIDQSVSHNGVCLTVEDVLPDRHRVTAIPETLAKTTLGQWKQGQVVNLERCMALNGRLDGHIVQGHVDATGTCIAINRENGGFVCRFRFPAQFASLVVEKGSICLDGISLTVFDVGRDEFSVAIIPYTLEHTNLKHITAGTAVNLEFDLVGKYILRFMQTRAYTS